jgi:hypothetical protein
MTPDSTDSDTGMPESPTLPMITRKKTNQTKDTDQKCSRFKEIKKKDSSTIQELDD